MPLAQEPLLGSLCSVFCLYEKTDLTDAIRSPLIHNFSRLARRFSSALLLFEILLYLEVTIQGRRPASFQPVRENLL